MHVSSQLISEPYSSDWNGIFQSCSKWKFPSIVWFNCGKRLKMHSTVVLKQDLIDVFTYLFLSNFSLTKYAMYRVNTPLRYLQMTN